MGKKIQCIGRYVMEGQTLGKGSFARVELARHTVTNVKVAIKIIDRSKLKEDYQKDHLHREARILGQLRHPNIIRLYETLKATTLHCLVLELAGGGELQTYIRFHKDCRLPEDKARPYVRQLVSALHYLHERGVAHRDLKMENIMLDEKRKHVKIVDFGLSVTFAKDELMKTHCGSPEYAAPELSADHDKYGPEIDVWSLGIVCYLMLVGHLPFTTPYTDHYRRLKLVQQMMKGLTEVHIHEMQHLSQECQDLLRKMIEPSPEIRISLLDMELHPWITNGGKLPFFPFQAFPRDKTMKSQGAPSLRQQTMAELSEKLEIKKEQVEQKVGETKSDEMSAMYNMMLDAKRREQGLYDIDHTAKLMERRHDGQKARRRAKSAPRTKADDKKEKTKGEKNKVPPALVLPAPEVSVESAPHSGNDQASGETETRMTSFDFLALCSTPTWLGPERRRSRRRSKSPNPAPQHNPGVAGESVRSKLRRDYMERHGIEASHSVAGRDEHHHGHHSHHHHGSHHHRHPSLKATHSAPPPGQQLLTAPEHSASNLSVPDAEGYNPRIRRGSSLKLSRRRTHSCGPGHKRRRSSFKRSGSVDNPVNNEHGEHGHRQLNGAKSDTVVATSPSAIAAATMPIATAFGPPTPQNVLTLQVPELQSSKPAPVPRPAKLTLKECYPSSADKAKKGPSLNAALPPTAAGGQTAKSGADVHAAKNAVVDKDAAHEGGAVAGREPAQEGAVGGSRTTLTSVEVHVSDPALARLAASHLPVPATGMSRVSGGLPAMDTLEVPTSDLAMGGTSWSTESLMGDSDNNLPSPDVPVTALAAASVAATAGATSLLQPFDLLDCSQRPVFHQQVPPHPLSLPEHRDAALATASSDDVCVEGATAMQLDVRPTPGFTRAPHPRRPVAWDRVDAGTERGGEGDRDVLCSGLEPSLRALTLEGAVGATGTSGNVTTDDEDYHEVEVIEEDDAALTGDSDQDHHDQLYFSAPSKKSKALPGKAVPGAGARHLDLAFNQLDLPMIDHSLPSPDEQEEDALLAGVPIVTTATSPPVESRRPKRGSTGSQSLASSSGSKPISKRGSFASGQQGGGKFKTPTTPMSWMVLRSPLARIESFHSDDFEYYNSSDTDHGEQASVSGASASPMSASTPTVPCFAYKLHIHGKKKPPKLKKSCPDNTAGKTGKRSSAADKNRTGTASRLEPTVTDPLLSSGSDTEHQDDVGEKTDDRDGDRVLMKTETKTSVYNHAITTQPRQFQNSVNKVSKNAPTLTAIEPKKKSASKNSHWKRSFAQFLKRKRQGPRCNSSNNNNNDCASSPMLPANHNGCSPSSPVNKAEPNNVQTTFTTRAVINAADMPGDISSEPSICKTRNAAQVGTENNIVPGLQQLVFSHGVGFLSNSIARLDPFSVIRKKMNNVYPIFSRIELCEVQSSPPPQASPDAAGLGTRVFDFTLLTDSPKGRPCLLSWRPCGDCGTSDLSSDEENVCSPDPVVTLDLKPLGYNNVSSGSHTILTSSYDCSQT